MRNRTILILRKVFRLIEEEATRNPDFAQKLAEIALSHGSLGEVRSKRIKKRLTFPDVYQEYDEQTATGFYMWLYDQPIATLKGIIKQHDLDPSRRSAKWNEHNRLVKLIIAQVEARLRRGSHFLSS